MFAVTLTEITAFSWNTDLAAHNSIIMHVVVNEHLTCVYLCLCLSLCMIVCVFFTVYMCERLIAGTMFVLNIPVFTA